MTHRPIIKNEYINNKLSLKGQTQDVLHTKIKKFQGWEGGVGVLLWTANPAFTNIFDNMRKISYTPDGILYSVFFDGTCNEAVNEQ